MRAELIELVKAQIESLTTAAERDRKERATKGDTDFQEGDYSEEEESVSIFPNGRPSFICGNWAADVRSRLGEQRVAWFGYSEDDNPTSLISQLAGGHDFAIVDGRYIVDGWVVDVECEHDTGIFDIEDDADLETIKELYGEPASWEPDDNALADPDNVIVSRFIERLTAVSAAPAL